MQLYKYEQSSQRDWGCWIRPHRRSIIFLPQVHVEKSRNPVRALSDPVLIDIYYKNTFHRIRWFIANVFCKRRNCWARLATKTCYSLFPHRCQLLEGCRSLAGSNLHGRHTASFTPFTPKKVQARFLASQNGNKCRKQIQAVNVFTDVLLQPSALPTLWKKLQWC